MRRDETRRDETRRDETRRDERGGAGVGADFLHTGLPMLAQCCVRASGCVRAGIASARDPCSKIISTGPCSYCVPIHFSAEPRRAAATALAPSLSHQWIAGGASVALLTTPHRLELPLSCSSLRIAICAAFALPISTSQCRRDTASCKYLLHPQNVSATVRKPLSLSLSLSLSRARARSLALSFSPQMRS